MKVGNIIMSMSTWNPRNAKGCPYIHNVNYMLFFIPGKFARGVQIMY